VGWRGSATAWGEVDKLEPFEVRDAPPAEDPTPGAARKGKSMYIGIGKVVVIVIIVLVVLMLRRRLCYADAPTEFYPPHE
jgi:hypothetical protein